MRFYLGKRSMEQLETCEEDLIILAEEMIDVVNFSVIRGFRGEEAQNLAYEAGASGCRWPDSYHNSPVSRAFDFVPYPMKEGDWEDIARFSVIGGVALGIAKQRGIEIEWGGSWGWDFGHVQLKR